jgi:alpha-tubulin suppressor-like RCC1 family protein
VRALPLLTLTAVLSALVATGGSSRAARDAAPARAAAVAAGLAHTCALTTAGAVRCWGYNGHDELGIAGWPESERPLGVPGLSAGVRAISAGVRHSCAITRAGGVTCWGFFRNGALGDGIQERHYTRLDVTGLGSGVASVVAGYDDSCALTTSGGVKCWGYNAEGQLGDGTRVDRWAPVDVRGLASGVQAIAAGALRTCALRSSGGVKCWGGGHLTPVDIPGLSSGVKAITTGCALTDGGAVECWGKDLVSADVPGLSGGVKAIAGNIAHSCALMTGGAVRCWGLNDSGQLGDGTRIDTSVPVAVAGLTGVTAISVGSFYTCALTGSGAVQCWGSNAAGQLGDGTTIDRSRPAPVVGFGTAKATLSIVSRAVVVTRAHSAPVAVRCGAQVFCRGMVTLSSGRTKLGSRAFAIATDAVEVIRVKLTPRAFRMVTRAKRLPTRVAVTGGVTAARTITLVAP